MKANWRRSQAAPLMPRLAFEKFKIKAEIEEAIYDKAKQLQDNRWQELNAYATAVDATILMSLHNRYRFKAKTLRAIWEDMIRLRIQTRNYFRDGGDYVEQETGKNIEDTAIMHDLKAIGVDIKAWENEPINVDEKTGEVIFGE